MNFQKLKFRFRCFFQNRIVQIVGGIFVILAGLFMMIPFIPGPGLLFFTLGILLVSPYHGRRIIWRLKLAFRWLKGWWYEFWYDKKRVDKRRRRFTGFLFQKLHINRKPQKKKPKLPPPPVEPQLPPKICACEENKTPKK